MYLLAELLTGWLAGVGQRWSSRAPGRSRGLDWRRGNTLMAVTLLSPPFSPLYMSDQIRRQNGKTLVFYWGGVTPLDGELGEGRARIFFSHCCVQRTQQHCLALSRCLLHEWVSRPFRRVSSDCGTSAVLIMMLMILSHHLWTLLWSQALCQGLGIPCLM